MLWLAGSLAGWLVVWLVGKYVRGAVIFAPAKLLDSNLITAVLSDSELLSDGYDYSRYKSCALGTDFFEVDVLRKLVQVAIMFPFLVTFVT